VPRLGSFRAELIDFVSFEHYLVPFPTLYHVDWFGDLETPVKETPQGEIVWKFLEHHDRDGELVGRGSELLAWISAGRGSILIS